MIKHTLTPDSITAAKALVSRLCENGHVRMSVPVDFARDEDMLICALIEAAEKTLATPPAASGAAPALPNLPEPFIGVQFNGGWKSYEQVLRCAIGQPGVTSCFTAKQMRDYALAALASREASPVALTKVQERVRAFVTRFKSMQGMHPEIVYTLGIGGSMVELLASDLAALASPQVAPALTDEDDELCQLLRAKMAKAIPQGLLPEFQQWVTLEQSLCYSRGRNEGEEFAKTPGQFEPSAAPVQVAPPTDAETCARCEGSGKEWDHDNRLVGCPACLGRGVITARTQEGSDAA